MLNNLFDTSILFLLLTLVARQFLKDDPKNWVLILWAFIAGSSIITLTITALIKIWSR